MRILSIGNSFSQDAHRYLSRLGAAAGVPLETVNLYIGGCSLSRHAENLRTGACAYDYEPCGEAASRRVSLPEVLEGETFDVVTLQQVSHESIHPESYTPHLELLAAAVRKHQPNAKLYLQETWAYKDGSDRLRDVARCASHTEMYERLHACYEAAARTVRADGILPVGGAVCCATRAGIEHMHRDGFHLSLGAGRYLAALVWLHALTGAPFDAEDGFTDFDEPISPALRDRLRTAAAYAFS